MESLVCFGFLATFISLSHGGPLASFGDNCKPVEDELSTLSNKYMGMAQSVCERHKKDGHDDVGTNPKDWDYLWKTVTDGLDIFYTSKAELPSKDSMLTLMGNVRTQCWKGSLCGADNRKVIGDCVDKTLAEQFLTTVGEDYISTKMNDANCKAMRDFIEGDGGKKVNEHAEKAMNDFDPEVVRKA